MSIQVYRSQKSVRGTCIRKDDLADRDANSPSNGPGSSCMSVLASVKGEGDRASSPEKTKGTGASCHIFERHRCLQSN